MAPMRREVSLIIRKPQLVGCQWILQPPAAVQQERVGHRHRSKRSGLRLPAGNTPSCSFLRGKQLLQGGCAGNPYPAPWGGTFVPWHSP